LKKFKFFLNFFKKGIYKAKEKGYYLPRCEGETKKNSKNLDEAVEFCFNPNCQLEDFNSKGKI